MGLINDMAQSAFRVGENGETIYLPNGVLSKGRVVTDSKRERQLRSFSLYSYKLLIPFLLFCMWYVDIKDPGTLMPVLLFSIIIFGYKKYLLRGLPVYTGVLQSGKRLEEGEDVYYPSVIKSFIAVGFIFLLLGLYFIFTSKDEGVGIALFPVFLAVVFLGVSLFMVRVNKSNKSLK